MGTGLFNYIAQACQSLAATTAPTITAMGIHIVIALATIVLVWFGVQEALASAHGGAGLRRYDPRARGILAASGREGALRNVHRQVAHALQIVIDLDGRRHQPQIRRHGGLQRQ